MNPFELLFWFVVMSWLPVFVLGCYCRNWVALFSGGIVGVFMVGHIVFQLLTGGAMSKDFSWLFYLLWASVIGLALMLLLLFMLHRDRARYNRRERMARRGPRFDFVAHR